MFFEVFDQPNVLNNSLFSRLLYCFDERCQRWETSHHSFWVKQCLDVVMNGIVDSDIYGSRNTITLPVLNEKSLACELESDIELSNAEMSFAVEHGRFLLECKNTSSRLLLEPLRNLCYLNNQLAHDTWVQIFPLIWKILSEQERQSLSVLLQQLLQQDYHYHQNMITPSNV